MDIFYSKRAQLFRAHCFQLLQHIIAEETEYTLRATRLEIGSTLYPLHVSIFQDNNRAGYCIPHLFEIGIAMQLLDEDESTLKNVIRHELAHLLTFFVYGDVPHHGPEFRAICTKYTWDAEVSYASIDLSKHSEKKKIQSKVQKLLALSHSSNTHEALSALSKAQQLIGEHALEKTDAEDEWISRRVLHTNRLSQKQKTIAEILRFFHVIPTFHSYAGGVYLDLFGTKQCVDYGAQIAQYLNTELEHLWNKQTRLKGARQKKSFFIGIAEGFTITLQTKNRDVIAYDSNLAQAYRTFVTKGSVIREKYRGDIEGKKIGQKEGKHLCIPKAASPSFIPGIQWQRAPIYNIPPDL